MPQDKRVYEFGLFRIDSEERLLYRADELIPLAPKVAETLLALLSNAGRIVGSLLTVLHHVGMVCGLIAIAVLALAPLWGLSRTRGVLAAIGLFTTT